MSAVGARRHVGRQKNPRRQIQTNLVRRAFLAKQKRTIDQLDVDPAVLHGLDAVGDLKDFAGGLFGIGVRPVRSEFSYAVRIIADGASRGAETNAPMRPSARSALPPSTDIAIAKRQVRKVPLAEVKLSQSLHRRGQVSRAGVPAQAPLPM